MTKVAVLGARGKLGSAVCEAVESADDLELVARIGRDDELSAITDAGAEVAVDVTTLEAVMGNAEFCLSHGVHTVIGTSGFGPDRVEQLETWLARNPGVGAMVVPNFSVGAVLMMRFAELAAAHFPSVEIVETHHERKADAPSGTARRTAELVAAARREAGWTRRPTRPPRPSTGPVGPLWTASRSTPCGCRDRSPTRRSSSAVSASS